MSHVAIHYKGEYIAYIFVQRKSFDVGYTDVSGVNRCKRLSPDDIPNGTLPADIQTGFQKMLNDIDQKLESEIPADFLWNDPVTG